MHSIKKKLIIAVLAAVTVLGALTACTKVTEKTEDGENTREELSQEDDAGGDVIPEVEDKDTDTKDAASGDSGEAAVPGEETQLNGMVEKIPPDSDDSFIIAKLVTEQINGVDIIGTDPDDTKITVVYSDDTVFVKQTIRDGGENVEETEGSVSDLREGFTVEMKGTYYKETVFFVTDVKIVEVIS